MKVKDEERSSQHLARAVLRVRVSGSIGFLLSFAWRQSLAVGFSLFPTFFVDHLERVSSVACAFIPHQLQQTRHFVDCPLPFHVFNPIAPCFRASPGQGSRRCHCWVLRRHAACSSTNRSSRVFRLLCLTFPSALYLRFHR